MAFLEIRPGLMLFPENQNTSFIKVTASKCQVINELLQSYRVPSPLTKQSVSGSSVTECPAIAHLGLLEFVCHARNICCDFHQDSHGPPCQSEKNEHIAECADTWHDSLIHVFGSSVSHNKILQSSMYGSCRIVLNLFFCISSFFFFNKYIIIYLNWFSRCLLLLYRNTWVLCIDPAPAVPWIISTMLKKKVYD